LWSPARPQLYALGLSAGPDAGWQTDVGLRQIDVRGGRLYLNRRRVVLYGASIHEDVKGRGDALLPSDDDAIVARLKRIGGNGHPNQAAWVNARAKELHRYDPVRPVAIDIWGTHIAARPGAMYRNIDLIGTTSYIGWYEFPFASSREKIARIRGRVARLHRL